MRQCRKGKRIFPGWSEFLSRPHFAKLFGKRTAVDVQIVCQPLPVKTESWQGNCCRLLPPGLNR